MFNFNSRKLTAYVSGLTDHGLSTPFQIFGALNLNAPNFAKQLELALGCIQVKLSDHIILTDSDQFSFFESGLLRTMSGESLAERRTELSGTLDLVDELEKTGLAGIN